MIIPIPEYNFKSATLTETSGFSCIASRISINLVSFQTENREADHFCSIVLKREAISWKYSVDIGPPENSRIPLTIRKTVFVSLRISQTLFSLAALRFERIIFKAVAQAIETSIRQEDSKDAKG
jgi:hypothetical protein